MAKSKVIKIEITDKEIKSIWEIIDMVNLAFPGMNDKDGFSEKDHKSLQTIQKLYDRCQKK
jgi:hypothetical protein